MPAMAVGREGNAAVAEVLAHHDIVAFCIGDALPTAGKAAAPRPLIQSISFTGMGGRRVRVADNDRFISHDDVASWSRWTTHVSRKPALKSGSGILPRVAIEDSQVNGNRTL